MKAVILDMYGVILKDPDGGFIPFVTQTFANVTRTEIYQYWDKVDVGEMSTFDLFRELEYRGDFGKIEKDYLDTVEINETFYKFASTIKEYYKLALLSNDSSEWSKYLRNKYKINDFFDVITVSGDVRIKKPDKRIFTLTHDKLGCPASDCVYVDDREFNLVVAQSLGMDAVLFNSRSVQYEGKTVKNFKELADMLIHS